MWTDAVRAFVRAEKQRARLLEHGPEEQLASLRAARSMLETAERLASRDDACLPSVYWLLRGSVVLLGHDPDVELGDSVRKFPQVDRSDIASAEVRVRELLDEKRAWLAESDRYLRQRWLRSAAVAALALLLVSSLLVGLRRLLAKPNLAPYATWTTSSKWADCHPERSECGGSSTRVFFHTNIEDSPWIRYSFPSPVAVSRVYVENRRDYGPDRALPLVVETSQDGQTFEEVARVVEPFLTTTIRFRKTMTRHLRLRVDRRSALHLEKVEIY